MDSRESVKTFAAGADISLVGEIEVRRELAAEGWLTINTNTEKGNFPNVDLIAVKGDSARHIQVKTTNGESGSHRTHMFLGRGEAWLKDRTPFFNTKSGPFSAGVVVLVNAKRKGSRFVILPVAIAEQLARIHVENWYRIPKRDGQVRSAGFDARIPFIRNKASLLPVEVFCRDVLLLFEDRWDVLDADPATLNSIEGWGVSFPSVSQEPSV